MMMPRSSSNIENAMLDDLDQEIAQEDYENEYDTFENTEGKKIVNEFIENKYADLDENDLDSMDDLDKEIAEEGYFMDGMNSENGNYEYEIFEENYEENYENNNVDGMMPRIDGIADNYYYDTIKNTEKEMVNESFRNKYIEDGNYGMDNKQEPPLLNIEVYEESDEEEDSSNEEEESSNEEEESSEEETEWSEEDEESQFYLLDAEMSRGDNIIANFDMIKRSGSTKKQGMKPLEKSVVDDNNNNNKLVPLESCADDCMRMPLMIGFAESCGADCSAGILQTVNVNENQYDKTALGIFFLNEVTDDQLTALRSQSETIDFIECNRCISTNTDTSSVCSTENVTFANEGGFNCSLKCRGADTNTSIAYKGECGSAIQSVNEEVLPLGICADDCMTMPLIIAFLDSCNTTCATTVMEGANIETSKYNHFTKANIIQLKEVSDEQLAALRTQSGAISSIECDSCVSVDTDEPVCSSINVTYRNEEEFECGLKCRGADTISIIAYKGACGSPVREISLGNCDADCMTMPLILTFLDDCDTTCATESMVLAGVSQSSYEHLAATNIIFLNEVTNDQLAVLRKDHTSIHSIECDSCSVGTEDAQVCGSDGVTYKNEDELNCDLRCRGTKSSVTMAYHGACHENSTIISIEKCSSDCMALPLMIGFKETCNATCQTNTMQQANIDATKFDHLPTSDTILLKEFTDEEFTSLQSKGDFINFIECNSCVSTTEVEQVCGTNGVTYKNEMDFSCGLKCRKDDKNLTIASQGVCPQNGVSGPISLTCDQDCTMMPLLIGFKEDCNNTCALETVRRANIPKANFDHVTNLNIIILNSVTDDQLIVLRGENSYISFIECDACVDALIDSPVCATSKITFRNAKQLTCENKCRETTEEISIAHQGPCDPTPTAVPTIEGGGGGLCFSSFDQVQLSNGETKQIDQLRLGDKVLTQNGYESIYSWSHHNVQKEAEFIQLLPSRIELSPNHLIFLENGVAVPAGTVKAGDTLLSGEVVTYVRSVTRRGVYAPFTYSGTIIVNGQLASTFVSLQDKSNVLLLNGGWSTGISHQWLAHAFEAPHRLWCSAVTECTKESYTSDGISTWVAGPLQFFKWSLQLPAILQLVLFLPILCLFVMLAALEFVVKNSLAVGLFGVLILGGLSSRFPGHNYSKSI